MIGQTLSETLNQMDPNTIVKVGSGNGFYYIGKVRDYLASSDKYDELVKSRLEGYKKRLSAAKSRVTRLIPITETYDGDNSAEAKKYRQKLRAARASVTLLTKAVESDKPFSEREVLDIYESCMCYDEGTICIKIDGIEQGKYWTIDETKSLPACSFAS